ncbi:MAG: 2-C-methyl-D-erythritol 4-phosphate cytidylyltransferase [Ruminococcaceae bacterium]|nr:2-C-methyl-D-erythritol 4-phosphate cytidylyltransferase [Oscillospiraceae bacterium]
MKLKNIFRSIFPKEAKHCTAIIVAGGSGNRMGSDTTKQMMKIDGVPVVVRTITVFENCPDIKEIVIVAKKDEIGIYNLFIRSYGFKKIKAVVCGGRTRQESVLNGFKAIDDRCDFVAIHDAARCLVTPDAVTKVLREAERYGAASAAAPAKDTVKIVDEKGFVSSTPDRNNVYYAQTPQTFKADLYRAAAFYALKKGFEATDDNSLVEYIGAKVKMVDCGYKNIKITTPEDIHIAEILLKRGVNEYE